MPDAKFRRRTRNLPRFVRHIRRMDLLRLKLARIPRASPALIAPTLFAAILCGCGGSGEGLDQNGRPISEGGADTPLTADFQSIQDHVFTPICAQCHAGASAPLGFRLDAGNAYAMLVNTPSVEVSSLKRVEAGDPDSSYIVQKIQGTAAVGGQMPLGQTPLPQATIDVIRQWIANGALPSAAASLQTQAAAQVRPIVPIEHEVLTRTSRELVFSSNGELDASTLNSASIVVTRADANGEASEQTTALAGVRIEIRTLVPTTFAVVLPPSARAPGEYRATVHLTGESAVLDRAGRPAGAQDLVVPFVIEDLP